MAGPVLLVHDDIATIAGVRRLLVRDGYEVLVVSSAADALIAFGHYLPSLIVLAPSVEGYRGSVILEELRQHPDAKLARVLLLGDAIAGFPFQVVPLPLDGTLFLQQVGDAIRGSPTEADQWQVVDSSQSAQPAEDDTPRRLTRDEWRATAPLSVGSSGLSPDIFGDVNEADWEVAAMTREERETHERAAAVEKQAEAAANLAFEQTHQEMEAEAIASIDRSLPAAPKREPEPVTDPGASAVEEMIYGALSAPSDPVAEEIKKSLADRRRAREEARRQKEEAERQMREQAVTQEVDAEAERAKLAKRRYDVERSVTAERERADKFRARAEKQRDADASIFDTTPRPSQKFDELPDESAEETQVALRTWSEDASLEAANSEAALLRSAAEDAARVAAEEVAAQEAEAARVAAEEVAAQEAEAARVAAEEVAAQEAEAARVAAEEVAAHEAEAARVAAEEAEAARVAAEEVAAQEAEAARVAAEELAAQEADAARVAAEEVAAQEAEAARLAAEEVAAQEAEAARVAAEEVAAREAEAARLAAEVHAAEEAARLAAEEIASLEAARLAAEEVAAQEAEAARVAAEVLAAQEAARLAAEEIASQEAARLAAEEIASLEAARLAAEEIASQEAARLAEEEIASQEAARLAEELAAREAAREAAEASAAQEEAARLAAEELAAQDAESARLAAEAAAHREIAAASVRAAEDAVRWEAQEEANRQEAARLAAEAAAQRELSVAGTREAEELAAREIARLSVEAEEKARALADASRRETSERLRREELERIAQDAEARADAEAQARAEAETRAHTQLQKLSSEREEARQRSIRLAEEAAEREVAANEAQARAAQFEEAARLAHAEIAVAEGTARSERERREQLTLELEQLRRLAEEAQERAKHAEDDARREKQAHEDALRAAEAHHLALAEQARAEAQQSARHDLAAQLEASQAELARQREAFETEKRAAVERMRVELEKQRQEIEAQLGAAAEDADRARAEARSASERVLIPLERAGRAPLPVMGAGAVSVTQLASLVSKLAMSKSEARLELQADDSLRILWFRRGALVGCASTVPQDSLLDRARRDGLIDGRQESELRLLRNGGSAELLRVLKLRGYVRETEAVPLVQRHHEQIALEALSEPSSTYRLSLEPLADDVVAAELPRPPMHLVAEALRRALASEDFLRECGGMQAVVSLTDIELDGKALGFTDRERRMLSLVDGEATIEELLLGAGIRQEQGVKALAVAHALRLVDVKAPVETPNAAPPDRDIERLEAKYEELADADYFSLLGLTRAAGTDEVSRAFDTLAREFDPIKFVGHPDAGLQHRARLVTDALSEAAHALADDRLRAEYARNLLD